MFLFAFSRRVFVNSGRHRMPRRQYVSIRFLAKGLRQRDFTDAIFRRCKFLFAFSRRVFVNTKFDNAHLEDVFLFAFSRRVFVNEAQGSATVYAEGFLFAFSRRVFVNH